MITANGTLLRNAESYVNNDRRAVVRLLVDTGDYLPSDMLLDIGPDTADMTRAEQRAATMPKGTAVTFTGKVVRTRTDHDVSAFIVTHARLLQVDGNPIEL